MSSIDNTWPDDGMDGIDLSFLGSDADPSPSQGIIPVPVQQDQSAAFVPLSAYALPPPLQDPNPAPPPAGTPSAAGIAKALDTAGYFPEGAAAAAKNVVRWGGGDIEADTLRALEKTKPFLTVPLAIGSGIAGTVSDIHQGTSPLEAIVGNAIRGGLVYGAGLAGAAGTPEAGGVGGIPAALLADHYLPPAPQIGHVAIGILGPLQSFNPAYDPAAF